MREFLEDIVKLFTDIDDDQPLPLRHKVIALLCVGVGFLLFVLFAPVFH